MTILSPSLSRRRFLTRTLATATALHLAPRAYGLLPNETCILNAEQETGPFYIPGELVRSSIAEDKPGVPIKLRLIFVEQATCKPIPNAAIDLWHCDAGGLYSGFTKTSFGPPPGTGQFGLPPEGPPPDGGMPGGGPKPSDKLTFLRGIQLTSAKGEVEFQTIFPGFYQGRTNHIHMKVRLEGHREANTYAAGHTAHTGQLFFPEDLNLQLMAQPPYNQHKIHRTTESEDGVFNQQHGAASLATVLPLHPTDPAAGFLAELRIAVDPAATPKPVGFGGRPNNRQP